MCGQPDAVSFANDIVACFEYEDDAKGFMAGLSKWLVLF